jgi:hypothetical protein
VAVGMGTKIHTGVYLFLAAHWEPPRSIFVHNHRAS